MRIVRRVLLTIALLPFVASPAEAQQRDVYDSNGRRVGRTERDGDRTHQYDERGRYRGTVENREGGGQLHLDSQRRTVARTTQQPDGSQRHYDSRGQLLGSSVFDTRAGVRRDYDPRGNLINTTPVSADGSLRRTATIR